MAKPELPSLLDASAYQPAPWWVPCVLSFFAGLAIPGAVLMSERVTPEYQRGFAEGMAYGAQESLDSANAWRDKYFALYDAHGAVPATVPQQ